MNLAIQEVERSCASRYQRLRMIKTTITENIDTDISKIETMLDHSLGGGKGLRALVAHISCDWCNLPYEECNEIAAAMEMIHVAALMHDDIVDQAKLRRDKTSANFEFGADAAVLAGDFLYSRASQLLCKAGNQELLTEVSNATNKLAEGEVLQLMNKGEIPNRDIYFDVINRKTAALFAAAAITGPVIIDDEDMISHMREYGLNMGIAFQIVDDCLDYFAKEKVIGKQPGMDFHDGKVTLPLLYGVELGTKAEQAEIKTHFNNRNKDKSFNLVTEILSTNGALDKSLADANYYTNLAINALKHLPQDSFNLMLSTIVKRSIDQLT